MNNINYIIINGERHNSVISAIYEIESIISRKDKGMWRPGWSNIDCDL